METSRAETDDAGNLVIIYDDSHAEDYTKAFPLHEEFGVPGCVAACPGLMGDSPNWLSVEELREMYEAGWEVMSHTIKHRDLGEIYIHSDIEPGDTEIHVQSNLKGRFAGDPLVVFDDQNTTEVTAAGRETRNGERFVLLEEPIDSAFEARDGHHTWVRYTDEFTRWVLEESKAMLEGWGFPVSAYVHPYNRYDGYVSEVVPEYYDAVANAGRAPALNPEDNIDPYRIGRRSFEEHRMTIEEIEGFLDTIVAEPVFGILYGHTSYPELPGERIERMLELALERDISIVTLQDLLIESNVIAPVMAPEPKEEEADDETDDEPVGDDSDESRAPDSEREDDEEPPDDDGRTADRSDGVVINQREIPRSGVGAAGAAAVGSAVAYGWYRRRIPKK